MTPKEYACLAQSAYSAIPDIGKENSAARIVFNHTPDGFVISSPGTNNESCALADVDAFPFDSGYCGKVHKGIWDAFDSVWMEVSKLEIDGLAGHSEAALGVMFLAARLCEIGKAPKFVYAFEPPRASIDSRLAEIFKLHSVDVYIYHHGNDIVPDIPVDMPFMKWQHPAEVIKFGKASEPFPNIQDHLIAGIIADLCVKPRPSGRGGCQC